MHRRVRTSLALVVSTLAFVAGCSGGAPEQKLLTDFFRSSRIRDSATLGNFATASFEPRTDGVVESFTITNTTETSAPLALKQYAKAVEDAKSADTEMTSKRRDFYNAHTEAVKRFSALEGTGKTVPAKDQALKAEWDKLVADGNASRKAVSDAQRKLSDARGIAELSLSRPNGATVDATKFDGEMTTKEVLLDASVKQPDGQSVNKKLKATMQRAKIKDDSGKDVIGRWIVTTIGPA
jgi:hypothetical protein